MRDAGLNIRASMGPPLFSDGDLARQDDPTFRASAFQWGHRFSAMETGYAHALPGDDVLASMGPPLFSDGDRAVPLVAVLLVAASMGPPLFSDGDLMSTELYSTWASVLQWGHRFSAMETPLIIVAVILYGAWLQWGHRFSAMETCREYAGEHLLLDASMGPPLFSDGDRRNHALVVLQSNRFNGATAFQRWRPGAVGDTPYADSELQWGHRFSAMETLWEEGDETTLWLLQWGHRFSAMETVRANGADAVLIRASMGPPLFSDGDPGSARRWRTCTACFNGATAFQRWRPRTCCRLCSRARLLQWGHRFSAMETPRHIDGRRLPLLASMGPPLFSDGDLEHAAVSAHGLACFNGATAFQRWRPVLSRFEGAALLVASMGPPLFSDGDPCQCRRPSWQ